MALKHQGTDYVSPLWLFHQLVASVGKNKMRVEEPWIVFHLHLLIKPKEKPHLPC